MLNRGRTNRLKYVAKTRVLPRLEMLEGRELPSTCTVTNLGDTGTGSGLQGDLRYCINQSNGNSDISNHIVFAPGVTGTISLVQGELTIGRSVEIVGPGASDLTVSGNHQSGVFSIPENSRAREVRIADLTIADGIGVAYGSGRKGGGLFVWDSHVTMTRVSIVNNSVGQTSGAEGGGLYNIRGNITFESSVISGNQAYSGGGLSSGTFGRVILNDSAVSKNTATYGAGIANTGTLLLNGSVVHDNTALSLGGGINTIGTVTITASGVLRNQAKGGAGIANVNGQLTIANSTIADNVSPGVTGGGILHSGGSIDISRSTLSGNRGYSGGAIYIGDGNADISNSTISGNIAEFSGGGVFAAVGLPAGATFVELTACTITRNISNGTDMLFSGGGGVFVAASGQTSARVLPRSSIIAGNTAVIAGPDVKGAVISLGYNLVGQADGSSGWVANDKKGSASAPLAPQLGPLRDNGGPTLTHAVLAGSPAIKSGDPGLNFSLDQRGTPRAYVPAPDVGAFEAQPAVAFRLIAPNPVTAGVPFNLIVVALDSWNNTASTYLGKIHFTSTDPAGQLPADYLFVASDGGTQTFTVVLQTPGIQQITAYDVTNVNRKGTVTVNVLSGRESEGSFSTQQAGRQNRVNFSALPNYQRHGRRVESDASFADAPTARLD